MNPPAIQYIHTPDALPELLAALEQSDAVAFDTEFLSESSYEPILCLLQVATGAGIWIVDPLAVPELGALWELLTESRRELVTVAAREEIRFCLRGAGRPPERLIDLQVTAGLLGYGYPLSHTNLVKKVLGVDIPGGEAFTDWKQRPLTDRQIEYAADDVRYLLAMRERLLAEAERANRLAWIEAECRRLMERVVSNEQEERWRRVSGSGGLRRRDLAVLRELWRWREQTAREANVPPRRIMKDELIVEIVKRKPPTLEDLLALRGLDRGAMRKFGAEIVAAVQAGVDLPNSELPEVLRRNDPPQVGVLQQLCSLVANGLAAEYRVDPALLATAADVQNLIRWHLGTAEEEGEPFLLDGWRGEILGRPMLDVLNGKRTVRVGNVRSPNPLVYEEWSHPEGDAPTPPAEGSAPAPRRRTGRDR
jgi:ribonuclease D